MTRTLPIVRLGRFGPADLDRILARARAQEPTHAPVGELLRPDPPEPQLAAERLLGQGQDVFDRAAAHFRSLGQARAVATVWPQDAAADVGTTLLMAVPIGPITILAVNRIVGVVDERDRWGFAYGTLPGHMEVGEEGFIIERRADGTVVARITALSHAALPASRLLQPLLLPIQRRYAERYLDSVEQAIRS